MHVLIVDDSEDDSLLLVREIRNGGFTPIWKRVDLETDLQQALSEKTWDIIFTDYSMPGFSGLRALQIIREKNRDIPCIMFSGKTGEETAVEAMKAGANDFILKGHLSRMLPAIDRELREAHIAQEKKKADADIKLLNIELAQRLEEINIREKETLQLIAKMSEYKDMETSSHVYRVAYYSKLLAGAYGLKEDEQNLIFEAAPLHDIGKIGISENIILKPGKLSPEEFEIIKNHTKIGYNILSEKSSKYLQIGASIALSHHEKFDGSGYPYNLKGQNIPIEGRITAISDVFDALTTKRPYKDAWTFEDALQHLDTEKGKHFDPDLIKHFFDQMVQVREIYSRFA